MKIKIFVLLDFRALTRLLEAPVYRTNFKILKIRNRRKALKAVKYCVPTKKKDKYFGTVERKSTIPKKLKMNPSFRSANHMRVMYSIVNKDTITTSNTRSA